MSTKFLSCLFALAATAVWAGVPGQHEAREGDEIVAAGQFFHTGTKVVLWMDPGGYDAYRVERRFVPIDQAGWGAKGSALESPNRYGMRQSNLNKQQLERVRGGGWDMKLLQTQVDEFVLHFDVEGCSRACFQALQDKAGISVHLMCDLDGTIYQTLDLKEKAWHATSANTRSIGIEIANVGGYTDADKSPFAEWYKTNEAGQVIITIPEPYKNSERTPHFVGRPARKEPIRGEVQGKMLSQYDFTPQQYAALVKLTATLCTIFPKIKCDYPREADGKLVTHKLADPELRNYEGVLGHYHIQTDKTDPGPALQWDYIIDQARFLMKLPPVPNVAGQPMAAAPQLLMDN